MSLLDLKCERPPTLGKSEVINDDTCIDSDRQSSPTSFQMGMPDEGPMGRDNFDDNGMQRPIGRGQALQRGRGNMGRGGMGVEPLVRGLMDDFDMDIPGQSMNDGPMGRDGTMRG
jgi:hypothetical protein